MGGGGKNSFGEDVIVCIAVPHQNIYLGFFDDHIMHLSQLL